MKAPPPKKGREICDQWEFSPSPEGLNESLHLKVQNKRSRGRPGDIDLSC